MSFRKINRQPSNDLRFNRQLACVAWRLKHFERERNFALPIAASLFPNALKLLENRQATQANRQPSKRLIFNRQPSKGPPLPHRDPLLSVSFQPSTQTFLRLVTLSFPTNVEGTCDDRQESLRGSLPLWLTSVAT